MQNVKFILSSNSNKDLDKVTNAIVKIIKETGVVISGPICLKNKRIVIGYNININTIDRLIAINPKSVKSNVIAFES